MNEQLTITTERVDDIPILTASAQKLGVPELLDEHFAPHGNWDGLRPGNMLTGWLTHILSEADHRLNRVQDWAAKRLATLRGCLSSEVEALDFSDDRLAAGLDLLSDDERWASFEAALNQRSLRVYDLQAKRVRIDTTTGSGYWQVTEDGLFQYGHSKDHRPDQPQLKVVLATLDPMGMPVATQIVAGNKADDPLYIPAIEQVRAGIGKRGLLYIGDCKMMALETRTHLVAGEDQYLGPFSLVQVSQEQMDSYLESAWAGEQALTTVERQGANGKLEKIAEGFERCEALTAVVDGKELVWKERRLVIRSLSHTKAATAALETHLRKAQAAILSLTERKQGKEAYTETELLRQAAEKVLEQFEVQGLLHFVVTEEVQERQVRKYGERPAERRIERQLTIAVEIDEAAIQEAIRHLGWRVYGTNCLADELSLEQAVFAYREEYLVERCFGRLKGKPLSLTPMYLQDDRRATALTRLLSIGLRILTLLEHVARCHLSEKNEKLSGLYAGNPARSTDRPTTEAMLQAFKDIFLNFVTVGTQSYCHLSPLSELQLKILALLGLPASIYTRLANFQNSS
jgi:transposase